MPLKKLFSVILCLVTVLFFAVVVQAENAVSLWSENVEVKNNRLFDVEIYVDSSFNLAAATFEISYDSSMMEYREVSTEIVGGQVKATDINGKVKAVFLKNEGISSNGGVKLFSAKFKAVAEGICNVGISMYDCVDNNVTEIKEKGSAQIKITVSGSEAAVISSTDEKSKTDIISATEEATETKSIKYLSVASPNDNRREYLFIIIFLLLIIIGLMFYSARLKNAKEKDTQQPENDTKDQDEPTDGEPIENAPTEEFPSQETLE